MTGAAFGAPLPLLPLLKVLFADLFRSVKLLRVFKPQVGPVAGFEIPNELLMHVILPMVTKSLCLRGRFQSNEYS